MRRTLGMALVMAIAMLVGPGAASPAQADHCFGVDVEPRRGPVGTEFVITQGSGFPGIVTLFHQGQRVARVRVGGRDGQAYRFVAGADDVGQWRAHLRIPDGDRPCGPNAFFTVVAAPDTAAAGLAPPPEPGPSPKPGALPALVLVLAALTGGGGGLRRFTRS